MHPHTLPNTQIEHNLLAPTGNSISPDIPIQPLDLGALPAPTITQPAKNLARLPRAKLKRHRRLCLEPSDGAAELEHRFRLVHALALEDQVLEPVVRGFDLTGHVRELEPDDRVVD